MFQLKSVSSHTRSICTPSFSFFLFTCILVTLLFFRLSYLLALLRLSYIHTVWDCFLVLYIVFSCRSCRFSKCIIPQKPYGCELSTFTLVTSLCKKNKFSCYKQVLVAAQHIHSISQNHYSVCNFFPVSIELLHIDSARLHEVSFLQFLVVCCSLSLWVQLWRWFWDHLAK